MSFGKMNTLIDIIERINTKDSEGFKSETDNIIASVRAYKEEKHGSRKWANMAAFTKADAIFKFRKISGIQIKSGMILVCDTGRYTIESAEVLNKMYVEAIAVKVDPSKG
ncbi:phage head completion protein [Clostridium sp. DL1XJH146]